MKPRRGTKEPVNSQPGNEEPVKPQRGTKEPVNPQLDNGEPVKLHRGTEEPVNPQPGNGEPAKPQQSTEGSVKRQLGGGTLIAVILLLLMSAALLNATRQQLDASLSLVADERNYLRQASLAASALQWGERERWAAAERWQCRTAAQTAWRACLVISNKGEVLLRGDSGSGTIALYRWVKRNEQNGSLSRLPHGWLDFCPLVDETNCSPDG